MLVIDKVFPHYCVGRDCAICWWATRERIVRCEGCGNYHVSVNGKIARHLCVGSA
jgi:hypothetical protein